MSRVLCVLAVMASSAAGCTGDPSNDDLTVLADAMTAVDDARAAAARDALAPTAIGVGGDTFNVWPASGVPMTGASRSIDSDGVVSFANGYWSVTIPVDAGTTLELAANVRDNGPATSTPSNTVSMSLMAYSAMSVVTLANASSDGSGKTQTISVVSDHVVGPAELILLRFTPLAPTTPPTFATMFSQIRTITVTARNARPATVAVAINAPRTGASPGFQGDAFVFSGSVHSAVFQVAGIPVGSTITGAKVRVRDNSAGPTRVNAIIYPSFDGSQLAPIATSAASNGSGTAQTLALSSSATVAALTTYSVYVNVTAGAGECSVLGIDVEYVPPR